jgi:hypothetical protein
LTVSPPTALQPEMELDERMLAHSDRLVLPKITAPASRRRATKGASRPGALFASAREPAVVGMSRVSMLSFSRMGRPAIPSSGDHSTSPTPGVHRMTLFAVVSSCSTARGPPQVWAFAAPANARTAAETASIILVFIVTLPIAHLALTAP